MRILITGGTGFIGSALTLNLLKNNHDITVITRRPEFARSLFGPSVKTISRISELTTRSEFDAVINLAGEGLADRPWTAKRKQELVASRVTLTQELVSWVKRSEQRPHVFISGSAVGWYGDQDDRMLEEDSSFKSDFLHTLCRDWEAATKPLERMKVRTCIVRTGIVLGRSGGMLKKILPIFGFGLGGRIGSGEQWVSWISLKDYIQIIQFLLDNPQLNGVFNGTAPRPVTNNELTRLLAKSVNRPAVIPVPAPVLKLVMGEMAGILLSGQRVLPSRLLSAGFQFEHKLISDVLA